MEKLKAEKGLVHYATTVVTLAEDHDPDKYYRISSGLWVSSELRSQVVAKAQPSAAGTTHAIGYADLVYPMTDKEIEIGLPTGHLFDETAACATIAGLRKRQPNGESGALLNNEYANLFCLSSCVVHVIWSLDDREWNVYPWNCGGRRWCPGLRVFYLVRQ